MCDSGTDLGSRKNRAAADPLTFAIPVESTCDEDLALRPYSPCDISEAMWEDLAAQIAKQRSQIATPAAILARRCEEGYAAAVVCEGRIAAYTSLSPVAEAAPTAHEWNAITASLKVAEDALPMASVYEFASSWTDSTWRCKHINMTLRLLLTDRFLQVSVLGREPRSALALGGMVGLTSTALARLGCRILAWDAAPFVSSLIGVPAGEFPREAAVGWRPPDGLKLYEGPDVPVDHPTHRWEKFIHCWVSNIDLAMDLNRELSAMMQDDLRCWRLAIVSTFTRPDSLHRLAFLPCGD